MDHGYGAYGTPSVEGCGVKAAIAWEATVIDLDDDARVVETAAFHRTDSTCGIDCRASPPSAPSIRRRARSR